MSLVCKVGLLRPSLRAGRAVFYGLTPLDRRSGKSRLRKAGVTSEFLTVVINGGVVVLLVIGIAGLLYKIFRPGGWFTSYVGGAIDGGVGSIVMAFIGLLIAGYLVRRWFDGVDSKSTRGDFLLYLALGLGIFFTFELIVKGSI